MELCECAAVPVNTAFAFPLLALLDKSVDVRI